MNVRSVKIFGDGVQTRDFVNVREMVQANVRAAQRAFGFAPSVGLVEGLAEYLAWAREEVART
jgi:nucleoside-diphosphate-sugar epimerase